MLEAESYFLMSICTSTYDSQKFEILDSAMPSSFEDTRNRQLLKSWIFMKMQKYGRPVPFQQLLLNLDLLIPNANLPFVPQKRVMRFSQNGKNITGGY